MRLYLISVVILFIGMASSVAIYVNAGSEEEKGRQYEVVGGKIYPGMQERSKKYRHDLEVYGGKAAVLADDFNRWFEGLWQGRTLAFTVATLSALVSLGLFLAGRYARQTAEGEEEKEDHVSWM